VYLRSCSICRIRFQTQSETGSSSPVLPGKSNGPGYCGRGLVWRHCCYFASRPPVEVRSSLLLSVCLFVWLSVCILTRIENYTSKFHLIFSTCYPWPWLNDNAIRYVLPVLWMTSCFHTICNRRQQNSPILPPPGELNETYASSFILAYSLHYVNTRLRPTNGAIFSDREWP